MSVPTHSSPLVPASPASPEAPAAPEAPFAFDAAAAPEAAAPEGRPQAGADDGIRTSYTAGGGLPQTHHPLGAGAHGAHGAHGLGDGAGAAAPKSYLTASLLSILIGWFGVDRFYLGKVGTGILKLVTVGGLGVWWVIDAILLILNQTRDVHGRALVGHEENRTVVYVVGGIIGALIILNGGWGPLLLF